MQRDKFSREFEVEAVKLVREHGGSAAQAARDLDIHENVLRKWVNEFGSDSAQAFPGQAHMKPMELEIERLRRKIYLTGNEVGADVFDYIERLSNAIRRHSTIGYVSPVEFERKVGLAYPRIHQTCSSSKNASGARGILRQLLG